MLRIKANLIRKILPSLRKEYIDSIRGLWMLIKVAFE